MKTYGTTQRRTGAEAPRLFDKASRKVCLDVQPCQYTEADEATGENNTIDGYSWIEMYLGDTPLDYGSVKSCLIEHAYPPKEEFAFLMNAVATLISMLPEEAGELEDIAKFNEMNEWRSICAATARRICTEAGTLPPNPEER